MKESENSESQPRRSNKSVCIKQLSIFKNTESYKKLLFLNLASLNHCKISAGIVAGNHIHFRG